MEQQGAAGDHQIHHHEMHASEPGELLQAYFQLWSHSLGYVKTMALKFALDLRIPDTIHRCGGAATIDDLLAASDLPPSSLPYLRRLMRAFTALRIFALRRDDQNPAPMMPEQQLTSSPRPPTCFSAAAAAAHLSACSLPFFPSSSSQ
ncbi:hypothetical protein U9M48_001953 [Paspalum notatum var. saurae]|uniref:O-methyltransferase dimerisation domain-containing protein n=1 Tax=Paspalum notatum var. saurae TaxID=547442 RepID=A0AAQ3PJ09_PASNO